MNFDLYTNCLTNILKYAITGGKEIDFPVNFDENEFIEFCKFHKVENIVYLTVGNKLSNEKKQELNELYNQLLMVQAKQMYYLEELEAAFEEEGIDYLLLKGREISSLYPSEDMRQSSDFDIYIGKENSQKARDIMLKLGY